MDSKLHLADEERRAITEDGSRRLRYSGTEELRRLRCAVACCMVSLFILAVLTAYLLVGNLRASDPEKLVAANTSDQVSRMEFHKAGKEKSRKPRAHLTATETTDTDHGSWYPTLQWEDKLGLAFMKDGMEYYNKTLVIPQDGYYFVYSQVTFRRAQSEKCKGRPKAHAVHIISKVTGSYPVPTELLIGTKSGCNISENWVQTISLGAVFKLDGGDKLLVNVSDLCLVDYNSEHKTYFGAFLL